MFVTERLAIPASIRWRNFQSGLRFNSRTWLPLVTVLAVIAGLGITLVTTPITARGDYGQWLMTSRFFLGEDVPAYRNVLALPPLVPLLIAAVRTVVADPQIALQVVTVATLAGLAGSYYVFGRLVLHSRVLGALSVAFALLVTDRFLELLAFGGLLQAAALVAMVLAVAAFARAGDSGSLRWWLTGGAAVAAAVLSHVGTGVIAAPIGVAMAGLTLVRWRGRNRRTLALAVAGLAIVLGAAALYWIAVLMPQSAEYVRNPASLAYRGPDRLFSALFSYWPTGLVLIFGVIGAAILLARDVAARRIGPGTTIVGWAALSWAALIFSALSGSATDYPRFATVLLAPLVPAASVGALHISEALVVASPRLRIAPRMVGLSLVLVIVVAGAPFAVNRFSRQARVYEPLDGDSLTAAVLGIDNALDGTGSVLTSVRDGKWLEGLTGREAVFALPVRYAFREAEWQRSVDADALLRSYGALTNGLFVVEFTDMVQRRTGSNPANILLAANHGGEFVDLLRIDRRDTDVFTDGRRISLSRLAPLGSRSSISSEEGSVTTRWKGSGTTGIAFVETVRLLKDGTTFELVDAAQRGAVSKTLRATGGTRFTSVTVADREATVCFAQVGDQEPCMRVWAAQPDAVIRSSSGTLTVRTERSHRLELHITALTAGEPSVGLSHLDPEVLVEQHDLRGALLFMPDPASALRADRLRALGFTRELRYGPYLALIREGTPTPTLERGCAPCQWP